MLLGTGVTALDIVFAGLTFHLILILITRRKKVPAGLRLPPGPPERFISGNASDIPTQQEWLAFNEWAKQYVMLVTSSADIARDLFEKRSSIYSDRPDAPMIMDLMGWGWDFGFMRYGEWWRRHHRAFHQKSHPEAADEYRPIQTRHTREFLGRLHETPEDFVLHLRHLAGAIIMETVYGIQIRPKDDPYIETAKKALIGVAQAGVPGAFLVDTLPILKYVPEWMPGAGFQKKARLWREPTVEMAVAPFAAVKKAINSGTAKPSIIASLLDNLSQRIDAPAGQEEVIRNVGAVAYAAGADTTVAALSVFILAMTLYPEVQKKAQAELDSVIGMNRLPVFEDQAGLPYINAVCNEVHRWHPVAPLGIAHRVIRDDVYNGYFIPKGTLVLGNSWGILHDEKIYGPRHEESEPERFLQPRIKAPTAQFGFGRRICAGRYLADNSVFIAVSSILKVFDITQATDVNGNKVPVGPSFNSGFLSHPEPFQCTIKPRSAAAEKLLLQRTDD